MSYEVMYGIHYKLYNAYLFLFYVLYTLYTVHFVHIDLRDHHQVSRTSV